MKKPQAIEIRERMRNGEDVTDEERTAAGKYWRREVRYLTTQLKTQTRMMTNGSHKFLDLGIAAKGGDVADSMYFSMDFYIDRSRN